MWKSFVFCVFLVSFAFGKDFIEKDENFDAKKINIVPFSDIVKTGSLDDINLESNVPLKYFLTGSDNNVVLLSKGTKVSMKLFLKGSLVNFESNSLPYLTLQKDIYLRTYKKKLVISHDLVSWHKLEYLYKIKPNLNIKEKDGSFEVGYGGLVAEK
jgi:hypothetical protein